MFWVAPESPGCVELLFCRGFNWFILKRVFRNFTWKKAWTSLAWSNLCDTTVVIDHYFSITPSSLCYKHVIDHSSILCSLPSNIPYIIPSSIPSNILLRIPSSALGSIPSFIPFNTPCNISFSIPFRISRFWPADIKDFAELSIGHFW